MRDFLLHLRLPFQLVLSPIFLWGALFATGRDGTLLLGFLIFHLLLCAPATVFNSFYDQDRGPVAWLRSPPAVGRADLTAALVLQLIGLGAALGVSREFAGLILILLGVSFAYSHPSIRLKGRPLLGLGVVFFAHGGGAFLAGFLSAGGVLQLSPPGSTWIALGAAMAMVAGLFPLTQVYQIEEDAQRGDRTLPVRYGWRRAFQVSTTGLLTGSGLAALALFLRGGRVDASLVAVGSLASVAQIRWWSRRFLRDSPLQNHDSMARVTGGSALIFGLLILVRLFVRPLP